MFASVRCTWASSLYRVFWMTVVPRFLSAGLMMIAGFFLRLLRALVCVAVRLDLGWWEVRISLWALSRVLRSLVVNE